MTKAERNVAANEKVVAVMKLQTDAIQRILYGEVAGEYERAE